MHRALERFGPPLRDMAAQLEWCLLHWHRLQQRLRQPEPSLAKSAAIGVPGAERVEPPAYSSALYGKMEGDDLRDSTRRD